MGDTNDKIFDDVFRTMLEKMPQLMLPLINEVFHTDYGDEDLKAQLKNEHHDAVLEWKRTTDSRLHIRDRQYHLECQKDPDSTMVIRMFEYDAKIALEESRYLGKGKKEIRFPDSCILYLTHNASVGNVASVPVRFADGHVHEYKVPIIKAQDYSAEEIFRKGLYVLLPYYVLRYENALAAFESDSIRQEALAKEYEGICERLKSAAGPVLYSDLIGMTKKILDYEIPENSKLRERMDKVMGGEVLELYSERVLRLDRSETVDRLIRDMGMSEEEACEFMKLKPEDYRRSKEELEEKQQEKEGYLPRHQNRRR